MKKIVLLAVLSIVVAGCVDPLTKYIKHNGFVPISPVSSQVYIGSIYTENDLSTSPILLLSPDVLTKKEADTLMSSLEHDVSLGTEESDKTYSIGADVAFIGKVSAALSTSGVKRYKVHVTGAKKYVLSEMKFKELLNNEYKGPLGPTDVVNKRYIFGLLKVSTLEYELYDEKETKLSVETLAELEKKVKAKLGIDWKVTSKGNLGFTDARFIGFRMTTINAELYKKLNVAKAYLLNEKRYKVMDGGARGFDKLEQRSSSQFVFEDQSQLNIALIFEVDNFVVRNDGVNVEADVDFVKDKVKVASAHLQSVFSSDDWRRKPMIAATGVPVVEAFLSHKENESASGKIVFLTMLQDFFPSEAPDGNIDMVINVRDKLANQSASQIISIQFKHVHLKPASGGSEKP